MKLIENFYEEVVNYYKRDPTSNKISLLWKEEFHSYKEELFGRSVNDWREEGVLTLYDCVMNVLSTLTETTFFFICDSGEINENPIYGDYSYYGYTSAICSLLYMKPSHEWTFPGRATFYGTEYQFTINSDDPYIYLLDVNSYVKKLFLEKQPAEKLKEFLKHSDRPLLDPKFK